MSLQDATAAAPAAPRGDEIVVYSPLARRAIAVPVASAAEAEEQGEIQHLQQTVQNLLRQNVALRGQIRGYETEVGALRYQQQSQMLHMQLTATQQMLHGAPTRNLDREEHLAGTIKSARLQIPCKEGPWTETQRLCTLDEEVEHLRQFIEYQYQHEMLWGADEINLPRFWYEKGGFWGRRTGPEGMGRSGNGSRRLRGRRR